MATPNPMRVAIRLALGWVPDVAAFTLLQRWGREASGIANTAAPRPLQ